VSREYQLDDIARVDEEVLVGRLFLTVSFFDIDETLAWLNTIHVPSFLIAFEPVARELLNPRYIAGAVLISNGDLDFIHAGNVRYNEVYLIGTLCTYKLIISRIVVSDVVHELNLAVHIFLQFFIRHFSLFDSFL
jgi:hypothetical protein